jgi:hypothetical protein
MNVRHVCKWCVFAALAVPGSNVGWHKAISAEPVPADAEQGVQVLTRGPVHEAFAETVTYDPEPGVVVSKAPPAAIEELPPDQRPEGANVSWIPGYWGWDDERNDFLWVSGVWRALPPGRQWVPGYWGNSDQGYQWTSGYWADAKASEVEYLPEPPATVEAGPNIAAPSADQTWLPGCWVWQQNRYAWRPGFWATVQPDWDWVPAHYVWAPRGYVYVDGYWDYNIARRGVLFAPVYFNAGVYGRPGFSYTPSAAINLSVFANHLFMRPQYQHYYFGDYYAANYRGAGYYPGFSINTGRFGYDPIYARNRWQNRQDTGWDRRVEADFQNRRDHEDLRPPRTWADQRALSGRAVQGGERNPQVAMPLDDFRGIKDNPMRFQPVDQTERRQYTQHAQEVQRFREDRQKLEASAARDHADARNKDFVPGRVRLPGSPIAVKPGADLGKDHAPPKTYEAPQPDPKVAAKPRVNRSLEQPRQRTVNKAPLDQPQPKVQQPQPKVQQPQPRVQQPQPRVQQPQPRVQQPQPRVQQPQPKVQQPQQHQPKAEKAPQQSQGNTPARSNQDKPKGKDKK